MKVQVPRAADLPALATARALSADAPDLPYLAGLVALLSRGDAEAVRAWHVLLHGGLLPMLAHRLEHTGLLAACEPRLQEALRSARDVNSLRNAGLRKAAVDASRALMAGGISPLWVKGIWLAHAVYEQPGLRTMSDVDLVVPEGTRPAARRILEALGYAAEAETDQTGAASWTDTLSKPAMLPGSATHVQIDLHDTIRMTAARVWPVRRLWARAEPMRIGGITVQVPSREAGLLYLASHLFKHGFDLRHALSAVGDAAAILRSHAGALDIAWLDGELGDPRDAAALYMLLQQVGSSLSPSAATLHERVTRRVEAAGLRRSADALMASAGRLSLSSSTDFSLFEVGDERSGSAAIVSLLAGLRRRARRGRADAGAGAGVNSLTRLFRPATWRYAYTTFLAGQLHARLGRTGPTAS